MCGGGSIWAAGGVEIACVTRSVPGSTCSTIQHPELVDPPLSPQPFPSNQLKERPGARETFVKTQDNLIPPRKLAPRSKAKRGQMHWVSEAI